MVKKIIIQPNSYYDSVKLMFVSQMITKLPGVKEAVVVMGTDHNKKTLETVDLSSEEVQKATPNDLIIAIEAQESAIEKVVQEVKSALASYQLSNEQRYRPRRLQTAWRELPGANLVLISIPGEYAKAEAIKALDLGLNVLLFSDNLTISEEKELKELAAKKGLLLMGPDCGTAIINHVPLAFANVVRPGRIGIVAASGTGAQEVSSIVHRVGAGISQLIGTGGRDLSSAIGGSMMIRGLEALAEDPETEVIISISKPPAAEVATKILTKVKQIAKPVVVVFIGGEAKYSENSQVYVAETLEEAALQAGKLLAGLKICTENVLTPKDEMERIAASEAANFNSHQKYLRGLFTGGTLASESIRLLEKSLGGIYSNIASQERFVLDDLGQSFQHTCLDLGADEFTLGRPHPMIEPTTRLERLELEISDQGLAVLLMDIVLGYGSHQDPAGAMISSLNKAKEVYKKRGGHLSIIASICGTEADPQNFKEQKAKLEEVGVVVMPTNAQAAQLAARIIQQID